MNTTVETRDRHAAEATTRGKSPMSRIVSDLKGALFFEFLAIVLNPLIALKVTGLTLQASADGHSAVVYLSNPSNAGFAVWLLLGALVTIPVIARTWRLIGLANVDDVAALKRLNPGGWGVVALIFSGLIQGILLLGASGRIRKLDPETR